MFCVFRIASESLNSGVILRGAGLIVFPDQNVLFDECKLDRLVIKRGGRSKVSKSTRKGVGRVRTFACEMFLVAFLPITYHYANMSGAFIARYYVRVRFVTA